MKDVIGYVENEMRGFDENLFNCLDSLVLSQFSYLYFDNLVPGIEEEAPPVRIGDLYKAENFKSMFSDLFYTDKNRQLFSALAASPRFRDIKMNYYVNKLDYKSEKQFSAVTYILTDGTNFIAYRGTDMTFVGWKEDFNMAYKSPIPSQEEGVQYLNTVGEKICDNIKVGGHSKGGNIAVYSSMFCNKSIQDKITAVFSHDGPGFRENVFTSDDFLNIKDRIYKIIPQSSIVGMLLKSQENYKIIESRSFGILQHDPFSWVIENGDFKYAESISNSSLHMNYNINQWLSNISDEKRELFIDALFQIINSTNIKSINNLSEIRIKDLAKILNSYRSIDKETRKFVTQTIRDIMVLYVKSLNPINKKILPTSSESSKSIGQIASDTGNMPSKES